MPTMEEKTRKRSYFDWIQDKYHYWTQRRQLIVQRACLADIACLESELETAAAHPEAHRVHVDVVGQRGFAAFVAIVHRDGGVFVSENCCTIR